jgi:hypothetical protein
MARTKTVEKSDGFKVRTNTYKGAAGGAGVSSKPRTYASVASTGVEFVSTAVSAVKPVIDEARIIEELGSIDLSDVKNLTDLKSKNLYWISTIQNHSGTFKCLLVRVHAQVFKKVSREHSFGAIRILMNNFNKWIQENCDSILADLRTNWSEHFIETALNSADVVYTKRNPRAKGTSIMVGLKANAPKAFDDSDDE